MAASFVDLGAASGPAIGLAKAAAKRIHAIVRACIDFRELRNANTRLRRGSLDASILGTCPLLGCDLLTEAESGTLYAFLTAAPLKPGWCDDLQPMMPRIEQVIRIANEIQRRSPFVLRGLDGSNLRLKGDHDLDFRWNKTLQRLMHEAKLIAGRDPRQLRFLASHLRARLPF